MRIGCSGTGASASASAWMTVLLVLLVAVVVVVDSDCWDSSASVTGVRSAGDAGGFGCVGGRAVALAWSGAWGCWLLFSGLRVVFWGWPWWWCAVSTVEREKPPVLAAEDETGCWFCSKPSPRTACTSANRKAGSLDAVRFCLWACNDEEEAGGCWRMLLFLRPPAAFAGVVVPVLLLLDGEDADDAAHEACSSSPSTPSSEVAGCVPAGHVFVSARMAILMACDYG